MMDALRQWGIAVAAAGLCGTMLYALAPRGNIEKMLRVVLSLFFTAAMLSPLLDLRGGWQLDSPGAGEAAEATLAAEQQRGLEALLRERLEAEAGKILRENGINDPAVSIDITVGSGALQSVDRIEIKTPVGEEKRPRIAEQIAQNFGIAPTFQQGG